MADDGAMGMRGRCAAIVSVGDELAIGQTLDTNARWIAGRLTELGVRVVEHATVPDDRGAQSAALRRLAGSAGVIVVTGGLGPTADDLTRHALADAMGDELVEDGPAVETLRRVELNRGRDLTAERRLQALRPAGAVMLENAHGTAPGLRGEVGSAGARAVVFCLPGPPREMEPMFLASVRPEVASIAGSGPAVRTRLLRCFGLPEADAAAALGGLMSRERQPLVGTTASRGVVTVRIRHEGAGGAAGDRAMAETEAAVRRAVGPFVFAASEADGGDALAAAAVDLLGGAGGSLVVAESCTGGLLGSMVTAVPGSSAVFAGGWLTYADAMKRGALGVAGGVLDEEGAVSGAVARSLASGALREASSSGVAATHALSVTGIAGPGGGSEAKPVGTVWIGLAERDGGAGRAEARLFRFRGDREDVRRWSAVTALGWLVFRLLGREVSPLLFEVVGEGEAGARC